MGRRLPVKANTSTSAELGEHYWISGPRKDGRLTRLYRGVKAKRRLRDR